jgi:hypothetical protein
MSYTKQTNKHIQYGILLWGHSPHVQSILILLKKHIRTIAGVDSLEHCRPLFIGLCICTIINLYIYTMLTYTKTNLHLYTDRQTYHFHDTRGKSSLNIPQHRLALTGSSFKINCIKFFNKLPSSAHNLNLSKFRNVVYTWLLENPFYSLKEFLECDTSLVS